MSPAPRVLPALASPAAAIPLQAVDPAIIVEAPAPIRAAGFFLLVVLFGGAILSRFGAVVDRSVASSMERPLLSVAYGLVVHGLLILGGGYVVSQLTRVGLGGSAVWTGLLLIVGVLWLTIAGFGILVVGTYATEAAGDRRPWLGLVCGSAALSLTSVALPVGYGLLAWVLVVSAGIGGPTKEWIHASRSGPPGTEG